jgi:hypothetical protein
VSAALANVEKDKLADKKSAGILLHDGATGHKNDMRDGFAGAGWKI